MELFMARHGEADDAEPKRYLGSTDLPLTQRGFDQARRLAACLHGEGLTHLVSSPLLRARQTADAVALATGLMVGEEPLLREIDFGGCEGLNHIEISQCQPAAWQALRDPTVFFPQGESVNDVAARVQRFADTLAAYPPAAKVLVVAHGGSLRILLCHLLGIDPGCWWRFAWDNAGLSLLRYAPPHDTMLIRHNSPL